MGVGFNGLRFKMGVGFNGLRSKVGVGFNGLRSKVGVLTLLRGSIWRNGRFEWDGGGSIWRNGRFDEVYSTQQSNRLDANSKILSNESVRTQWFLQLSHEFRNGQLSKTCAHFSQLMLMTRYSTRNFYKF